MEAAAPEGIDSLLYESEELTTARAGTRSPAEVSGGVWWVWACAMLSILWISQPLAAQISPGSLSRAHQSLSGLTQCTTCHELSTGKPTVRCLACHTEIARRVSTHQGVHATYNIKPGSSAKCAGCHSEHNGEDFALINWNLKTFDHSLTGYALLGKHAGLSCNRCHSAEHVAADERASIKMKDLNRTFLGVLPSCTNCHQDEHKGRLGPDCLQCHNFDDWKTLNIGNFDHSQTRYPLTGLHVQVACKQCHTPGSGGKPRYRGIPFASCADCHADPHRGGFSQTCESCHSTAGWKQVRASALLDNGFDHAKTKFPLLGKHAEVECMQCHAGGDFKKPLAFQKCMDCHQPDPHGGQFAKRPDKGECASCHTVDGFTPSTFGLKQHAASAYPLEGKHATLQCAQCHIPKGKDAVYMMKFQHCTDCHSDEHEGQFAAAPYRNACESCHTVQRMMPSTFGLPRHKSTSFPLTGSHEAVACNDCHRISTEFRPKPTALYHWRSLTCTTCHADPHKGQFDDFLRRAGERLLGCEACHSTVSWKEFSRFDHSKTSFPLLGAHETTPCQGCHNPPGPKVAFVNADFKAAPKGCEACHADVHGGQFAKARVTACADCHDSAKWKPSLFDHDKRTDFPLSGAHRKAACEGCHKLEKTVAGKAVLFYKPTPKECAACHGADVLQRSAALH